MTIYTDGACSGNPGPGGYGVVVVDDNDCLLDCYTHHEPDTTNNRQELKAIIYAMIHYAVPLKKAEFGVAVPIVYSDSAYAVNTLTQWAFGWKEWGWVKNDYTEPKNLDLIKGYFEWYDAGNRVDIRKVKGHDGVKWNEVADALAAGRLTPEEVKEKYGKKE